MKSTAFLVNCSDAQVIDQAALVCALTTGRIAGAAFDVFETHPIAPDNPLLQARQRHTDAAPRRRDGRDHPTPLQDDDRRHSPILTRPPSRQPRQSRSLGPPCPNDPVLVIDAGSSSIRCHLVGIDGRVTGVGLTPMDISQRPQPSRSSPASSTLPACWSSLCDAIRECVDRAGE